ncbi:hypothetical protein ACI1US_02241 [Leucobacter sp. BZR 635]
MPVTVAPLSVTLPATFVSASVRTAKRAYVVVPGDIAVGATANESTAGAVLGWSENVVPSAEP